MVIHQEQLGKIHGILFYMVIHQEQLGKIHDILFLYGYPPGTIR